MPQPLQVEIASQHNFPTIQHKYRIPERVRSQKIGQVIANQNYSRRRDNDALRTYDESTHHRFGIDREARTRSPQEPDRQDSEPNREASWLSILAGGLARYDPTNCGGVWRLTWNSTSTRPLPCPEGRRSRTRFRQPPFSWCPLSRPPHER